VNHKKDKPSDCLAYSAAIFSTTQRDDDFDGLPNRVETEHGLLDAKGHPLPDFANMGANPKHKDVFIEVGSMYAHAGTAYGSPAAPFSIKKGIVQVVDNGGHNHLPTTKVIKDFGDAYKFAPVANPDGSTGIRVHIDPGPHYHAAGPAYASADVDEYLVPASEARGGEAILEKRCEEDTQ